MNSAISQQRRSRHATSGVHHHPLLNGKLQRTLVRIASLVTLGGAIAGIASLLSPSPKPCFVELQLLPAADQWTLRETVIANDIAALRSGRYFRNHIPLIDGDVSESGATKTLLTGQLERLAQMKSSQSLVVYLAGTGIVDGEGELWVAIGDEVAGNGIRLSEILSIVKRCPAREKFLIIDLAAPEMESPWTTTSEEIAQRVRRNLQGTPDPARAVLIAQGTARDSLTSEKWQRTAVGYFFEHALRGHADGVIDGKKDGCVTAEETARYVQSRVEQWSRLTLGVEQRLLTFGTFGDAPLVTISAREQQSLGEDVSSATFTPYPKWLSAAWQLREQAWDRGDYRTHPRLFRRLEQNLLKVEGQWRGGRAADQVQATLERDLQSYQKQLQKQQAALPTVPQFSICQFGSDRVVKAALPKARAKLQQFQSDLVSKTRSVPPEAVSATRQQLIESFAKKNASLSDDVLVLSAFEELIARELDSLDTLIAIDKLISLRQPQPKFVETLLIRRLADIARASPEELDIGTVQRALRVANLRGNVACLDRSFPGTEEVRRQAWQAMYEGNFLVLRPGYAPVSAAAKHLQRSEKAFEGIAQSSREIEDAWRALDEAMIRLPMYYPFLATQNRDLRLWVDAVDLSGELWDTLTDGQADNRSVEDVDAQVSKLRQAQGQLTELLNTESTLQLVHKVKAEEQLLATREEMQTSLRWPGLKVEQRRLLLEGIRAVDTINYERLAMFQKHGSTHVIADGNSVTFDDNIPETISTQKAAHALLKLGGLNASTDDHLSGKFELRDVRKLIQASIDSEENRSEAWKARSGAVLPIARHIPWLDAISDNPYLAMERNLRRQRIAWLAEEFAYRAHDDTPVLHTDLCQRCVSAASLRKHDRYLLLLGESLIARPTPLTPNVEVDVRWKVVGSTEGETEQLDARTVPGIGGEIVSTKPLPQGLQLTISQPPGHVAGDCRGVMVEASALQRTWHFPLEFKPVPWGSRLQLQLSQQAGRPGIPAASLRLRPATEAQTCLFSIANPTDQAGEVIVEVPGVGTAHATLQKQSLTPLEFVPPATAKGEPVPVFDHSLPVRVVDAKTHRQIAQWSLPLEVISPAQYVRVTKSRFLPGEDGDNRLTLQLSAEGMPQGPPCIVQMNLSKDDLPGLVGIEDAKLSGELPADGSPLTLYAAGMRLLDGRGELGSITLTVDGVEQAISFAGVFPRRGDPTTPRQVARPQVTLDVPKLAPAGPGFQVPVHVLQGPQGGSVHLRIGKVTSGGFVSQLHQQVHGLQQQQIHLKPQKDGSLALKVTLSDWKLAFDTSGMVGQHRVVANIVDRHGRSVASAMQDVVFDNSPADVATFLSAPLATVNQPIALEIAASDSLSGIDKVLVFPGLPSKDGKLPAGVKPIQAVRQKDSTNWIATLGPEKLSGPLEVTAQVINAVGLTRFESTAITVEANSGKKLGSVSGTITEGPRPQPNITVQLFAGGTSVVAQAKTGADGSFRLPDVKPGNYSVHADKPSSGRKANKPVSVKPGQSVQIDLQLAL